MNVRPGTSAALSQLQSGITLSAGVIAVCLAVQMIVFGFVHFTTVRFESVARDVASRNDIVAAEPTPSAAFGATPPAPQAAANPQPGAQATPVTPTIKSKAQIYAEAAAKKAETQTVLQPGKWDRVLGEFSGVASSVGILATLVFVVQLAMAVVVAAGAAVPGVERVVAACTAGLFLGAVSLPLSDFFHSMPLLGAFSGYPTIAQASEETLKSGGEAGLVVNLSVVPFFAMLSLAWIVVRVRSGVAAGIHCEVTAAAQRKLDSELSHYRDSGIGSNIGGRSAGVLGRTMEAPPIDPADAQAVRKAMEDLGRVGGGAKRPI